MSEAVEVLQKTLKEPDWHIAVYQFYDETYEITLHDDLKQAIKSALLALDKLDKLEKWLDKEEKELKEDKGWYFNLKNKLVEDTYNETRTRCLKEVREVLK